MRNFIQRLDDYFPFGEMDESSHLLLKLKLETELLIPPQLAAYAVVAAAGDIPTSKTTAKKVVNNFVNRSFI